MHKSQKTLIDDTQASGGKVTINHDLKVLRRNLNLAESEWIDEYAMTWLLAAQKIKLLPDTDKRKPYPLSWNEQDRLFKELPGNLAHMALFGVNTGCRVSEVCNLQWEWKDTVPEIKTSVFIIPGRHIKNGDDRLIVLNRIAMPLVNDQHGKHTTNVLLTTASRFQGC